MQVWKLVSDQGWGKADEPFLLPLSTQGSWGCRLPRLQRTIVVVEACGPRLQALIGQRSGS